MNTYSSRNGGGGNPSYNIIKLPSEMIHNNIIYNSDLNGNVEPKGKIWNLAVVSLNPYILLQNNVKDTIFIFDCFVYLTYEYSGNSVYLSKTLIYNYYAANAFCFRPMIEFKE